LMNISQDMYNERTKSSLMLAREIGNMYTASLYGCLISYLLSKPIDELANKRLLLFSYGSGMAASLFSAQIASDTSPDSSLSKLLGGIKDIPDLLVKRIKISPLDFEETLKIRQDSHHKAPYTPVGGIKNMLPGTFYLSDINEKYHRKYERIPIDKNKST